MAKKEKHDQRPQPPQVTNKKAFHDYELVEKVQAGVSLLGTEVKSLRNRGGDLEGSFARIIGDECWLIGAKIAPYAFGTGHNHEPDRKRKLLLHRAQIRKIVGKLQQRGFTLVPLRIYFNERGLAKVELALATGKRQYDKRAKLQKEQQRKDTDRAMKKYRK
jgi:SsrA-binding protein